jgi:hypothetical protein
MIVDLLNQYNMIEKNNYQLHKNLRIQTKWTVKLLLLAIAIESVDLLP